MAYSRLNKKDGEVLTAANVTHIEDGIVQNESDISEVNQSLTDIESNYATSTYYGNNISVESFLESLSSIPSTRPNLFCSYGEVTSFLTNGVSTATYWGIVLRNGTSYYDYILVRCSTQYIYFGSITVSTGQVTSLRRIAGDSLL